MSPEGKRALIAAVRRLVMASVILLVAWLLVIHDLLGESGWFVSFWTGKPVVELISESLGATVQLLVFGVLLSLTLAAILLFLGVIITLVTDRPGWLARVRCILRLILVSGGVSTPIFILGTLFGVYAMLWWDWSPPKQYGGASWWLVFFVALLPTWLLVQAGQGELANWPGKLSGSFRLLARHISIRLIIRLLKLVGAIIVVTMFVEQIFAVPGLGRLMFDAANKRDYPVFDGTAWFFVCIVVLVKLVGDLIEIAYNHFGHLPALSVQRQEPPVPHQLIPKGWLIFCLVLVLISIMAAAVGPFLAPEGYNEISLADRLAPPSTEHILGADNLGRDIFSRLLHGTRTTLLTGLLGVGILLVVATGWAILAAFLRKQDNWRGDTLADLVMLPRDVICAFPWLVLLLLLMSMVGPGFWQVALVGSLVLLPRAVSMMQEAYHSPPEGRGWLYSVLRSLPAVFLLVVAGGILYTSSLSFLGWGILPPVPELGGLLSESGRRYMIEAPWMAQWPALCLVLLSLAWVMAGEALLERSGFRSRAVWAKVME